MIKRLLQCIFILWVSYSSYAITLTDAEFCVDKELWQILAKHEAAIKDSALVNPCASDWLEVYLRVAENETDTLAVLECLYRLASYPENIEQAVQWIELAEKYSTTHTDYAIRPLYDKLAKQYDSEADRFILKAYYEQLSEDSLYAGITRLKQYNQYVEELAKNFADLISTERNDSHAETLTEKYYKTFPFSQWSQVVYYFELARLSGKSDYTELFNQMKSRSLSSPAHSYITSLYLLSPSLRRELSKRDTGKMPVLEAQILLDSIDISKESVRVLYDNYVPEHWQARLQLQKVKAAYYLLLEKQEYFGDEDSLVFIDYISDFELKQLFKQMQSIHFENNDSGEQAELLFWKGRILALSKSRKLLKQAARLFTQCLIQGAPRKKYDAEAISYLTQIHRILRIRIDLLSWQRQLMDYEGIIFKDKTESAGILSNRETRVALGDYNNDSITDILLSGRRLFRNDRNLAFTDVTDSVGISGLAAAGGLFADFNLDGRLDFMTISHNDQGNGEKLLKNNGDRFVPVNERAGDIDDTYPTEGAAWVDCFQDGFPELYCANYEKWNVRSGYDDRFWNNENGYFTDKSQPYGFLSPAYTTNPGQAGRGVAPADFDNDGTQEILVTNYRLDRNFLWDCQDSVFIDNAALYGLQGILKKGYYGHSIGADWGDFDNDGDLDLFIANLAHPRYIEISDVSMLLRNDGSIEHVIEGDTIRYWRFTDVTKQAGVTYDELHSDPLWFDADNDGFLDLFITSVYENDRSYLYHNNADGTFTDVSWLSGTRTYNGWSNACADLDRDGKLDLVVGSGNGVKIYHNTTRNTNSSLFIKPIWEKGEITLLDGRDKQNMHPNSPAFGTRVILSMKTPKGKTIKLIRELSSAKGTTSQNDQWLHFGLRRNKLIGYEIFRPEMDKP